MSCDGSGQGKSVPASTAGMPAVFPEFRRRLIADAAAQTPLKGWRPQRDDDLGVMLLEMAAYMLDVLAFYDSVISDECFLRTAKRRPSVRRLVELVGYRPRPAVAASVSLAVLVDGNRPVLVPAGTQFRSTAVGKEPPQIFETNADRAARPGMNSSLLVSLVAEGSVPAPNRELLLGPGAAKASSGDIVVIRADSGELLHAATVQTCDTERDMSGRPLIKVMLTSDLPANVALAGSRVRVLKATQRASLWAMEHVDGDPLSISGGRIPLFSGQIQTRAEYKYSGPTPYLEQLKQQPALMNGLPGITQNRYLPSGTRDFKRSQAASASNTVQGRAVMSDKIIVAQLAPKPAAEQLQELAHAEATEEWGPGNVLTLDGLYRQIKARDYVVLDWGAGPAALQVTKAAEHVMHLPGDEETPSPTMPVTRLTLASSLDIDEDEAAGLLVYYGFSEVGTLVSREPTELSTSGTAVFKGTLSGLADTGECVDVLAEDGNGAGASGSLSGAELNLDMHGAGAPVRPVTVYANVIQATRGETVAGEVLGSGDASLASQSFRLKKGPLTRVRKPTPDNESGTGSTLEVRVDGVLWREAVSFYDVKPTEEVYVVRDDDEGRSHVVFGDGVHGARLPSGTGNVVASYRFGAGAMCPPAGSITQLARPVRGLRSAKNPLAAYGGGDAETADDARSRAPYAALILGRAVSVKDFEAVASGVAGVNAVHAEWTWDAGRQRPVVLVAFVGDEKLETDVAQAVLALSDPTVPVKAKVAKPKPVQLWLEVESDSRYVPGDVERAVTASLAGEETGLLAPARLGVGQPAFRSRILQAVHSVAGVVSVTSITVSIAEGAPISMQAALECPADHYLSFTVSVKANPQGAQLGR